MAIEYYGDNMIGTDIENVEDVYELVDHIHTRTIDCLGENSRALSILERAMEDLMMLQED